MVWIETHAERSLVIAADKSAIRALIVDVPTSGPFFPGVDRIDDLGDHTYGWWLTERRTLGTSFRGEYVTQYDVAGEGDVTWRTLRGNLEVTGRWSLSGPDGSVRVTVAVTTKRDAPVPRVLKKPAILFAEKEARDGLAKQLERVKDHLRRI